jgi:hypothetical protein
VKEASLLVSQGLGFDCNQRVGKLVGIFRDDLLGKKQRSYKCCKSPIALVRIGLFILFRY